VKKGGANEKGEIEKKENVRQDIRRQGRGRTKGNQESNQTTLLPAFHAGFESLKA
jgi:hypothetical protein